MINIGSGKGFDKNFNLLLYTMLFFVISVSMYLYIKYQEQAGLVYFSLLILGGLFFAYTQFFRKNNDDYGGLSSYMRVPITTIVGVSAFVFVAGWIIRYLFELIGVFTGLNFVQTFSIPLTSVSSSATFLTFQSAIVSNSPGYTFFNLVINAGVTETILFNLISVGLGVIIGIGLLLMLKIKVKGSRIPLITGLLLSLVTFVFLHNMNSSYTTGAFIFASVFILLSNVAIYYFGVPILLAVGFHMANNFIYMVQLKGLTFTLSALFGSFIGLISIAWWLLIIICIFRYWKEIMSYLRNPKKNY